MGIAALKKVNLDETNVDCVNTNLYDQSDLENLYTNDEIPASDIYSQAFSSLWSIMTFSAGMPILYFLGFVNCFIIYWMYKILILKSY